MYERSKKKDQEQENVGEGTLDVSRVKPEPALDDEASSPQTSSGHKKQISKGSPALMEKSPVGYGKWFSADLVVGGSTPEKKYSLTFISSQLENPEIQKQLSSKLEALADYLQEVTRRKEYRQVVLGAMEEKSSNRVFRDIVKSIIMKYLDEDLLHPSPPKKNR